MGKPFAYLRGYFRAVKDIRRLDGEIAHIHEYVDQQLTPLVQTLFDEYRAKLAEVEKKAKARKPRGGARSRTAVPKKSD